MTDNEGFLIYEEGTPARQIPIWSSRALYYATWYGHILRFDLRNRTWHVVKPHKEHYSPATGRKGEHKYLRYHTGSKKSVLANKCFHRLVLMSWKPNPSLFATQCDHIDNNPRNNRVDNLRWCTDLENKRYASAIRRGETILSNLQKSVFYAYQSK